MKRYISLSLLLLFCCSMNVLYSQCVKPTPMNAQQVKMVTGKWKGNYTYKGETRNIEIDIYPGNDKGVVCNINNPPLTGKEMENQYFFCPGGEFHLKKYVGEIAYVFQGVPENGRMKGIVSIYTSETKRTQAGNFVLERVD